MKKITTLLLLFCVSVFAALPAGTQWEIWTTGNDNNGGGFVAGSSGTDRSQSATPFCSATDLVLPSTTTATSATCPFSAASVGNLIHITAGANCTAGFYQVVSVAVVTATLDRVAGTVGCVAGTFRLGGALVNFNTATTPATAGNTIWVKNTAAHTITTTISFGSGGSSAGPVSLIGYGSTHGDDVQATITTATNSTNLITFQSNMKFENLNLTTTAATKGTGFAKATAASGIALYNVTMTGFTQGFFISAALTKATFVKVEIKTSIFQGFLQQSSASSDVTFINSYIHNNGTTGGSGVQMDAQTGTIAAFNSVFSNNQDTGILSGFGVTGSALDGVINIQNCVFYGNTNGVAAGSSVAPLALTIANNVFYGNTGTGVYMAVVPSFARQNKSNGYGANGTNRTNVSVGDGDITLTADPFTNAASADYTLNNASGGGKLLKGTGWPGNSAFGQGHNSVGAVGSPATQSVYGGMQ